MVISLSTFSNKSAETNGFFPESPRFPKNHAQISASIFVHSAATVRRSISGTGNVFSLA